MLIVEGYIGIFHAVGAIAVMFVIHVAIHVIAERTYRGQMNYFGCKYGYHPIQITDNVMQRGSICRGFIPREKFREYTKGSHTLHICPGCGEIRYMLYGEWGGYDSDPSMTWTLIPRIDQEKVMLACRVREWIL